MDNPEPPRRDLSRSDFGFDLPEELIAQAPPRVRGESRLLSLDEPAGSPKDLHFADLMSLLRAGDLLVRNRTRVLPARVHATKDSGGRVELMLERVVGPNRALMQMRASKATPAGRRVALPGGATAVVVGVLDGFAELEFDRAVVPYLEAHGEMPLPPYIRRPVSGDDRERYQTVYARAPGAVAAPTAGLHFSAEMFDALTAAGVELADVTLHVGAGTYQPLRAESLDEVRLHEEWLEVDQDVVDAVARTRARGGRVVAVGTTVVRSLETAAAGGTLAAYRGPTRLFIRPGYVFRVIDVLVTNFHLPESSLMVLVCAFGGRERVLAAYRHAVQRRYRFFSYGDAMLLTPGEVPRS